MKYRTVLELVSDAENKNEAVDIAGEFLRGNLERGVSIKCHTKPLKSHLLFQAGILLILVSAFMGIASQTIAFKKSWQEEKNKKVLEHIKQ